MSGHRLLVFLISSLVFILVEVFLYRSYVHHDANFHWFTHFFAGTSVALIGMSVYAWRTNRAVRYPLYWLLGAHILAMLPDLLFQAFNIAHRQWMDIFIAHISSHFIKGGNTTWYGIFLACLAVYLFVVHAISLGNKKINALPSLKVGILILAIISISVQLTTGYVLLGRIGGLAVPAALFGAVLVEILAFLVLVPFLIGFLKVYNFNINFVEGARYMFVGQGFAKLVAFGDYIAWRHLLKKHGRPIAAALEFIILLYSFAFLSLVGLFLLSQLAVSVMYPNAVTTTFAGRFSLVPFVFTIVVVMVFLLRKTSWLNTRVQGFFAKYFGEPLVSPKYILKKHSIPAKTIFFWVALSIATWLLEGLVFFLCLMAAGIHPPPIIAFYGYTFVRLFQFLPFFPGGIGEIEAASTLLFTAYGYQLAPVVVASILFRFVAFWSPVVIGLIGYFVIFKRKIK